MKSNSSRFILAAASLVCVLILAACNCAPVLRYVTITPTSATINVGTSQQFTAQAYYSDGSIKDGTSLVTWGSSNPAVATIVGGLASAIGPGTTTITATAAGTPGATATLNVNQLLSIAVTPVNQNVPVGNTQQYDAMGTYNTGTVDITTLVTWSASPSSVATITTGGLATAVGSGTATITASLDGVSGSTSMITGPPVPVSLTVSPSAPTIAVGNAETFTATENWSDGTTGHVPTGTVTWTSGTTTTATIIASTPTSTALAAALAAGTTMITASEGALTPGTTTLTVVTGKTHYAYISNNSSDTIQWYSVNATTSPYLTSQGTIAQSAPTQTVVHPSGSYVYATDAASNVLVFNVNASTGALTASGYAPQAGGSGNTNFMVIDPYGRFLYVSDDITNTIHGFTITQSGGTNPGSLTPITMSPSPFTTNLNTPECLIIDPSGSYLYATNSGTTLTNANTVAAYSIDQTTGALTPLATPTYPTGIGPFLAALDPSGTHLYTANSGANSISGFTIGAGGALTSIGAAFAISGATTIFNVVIDPSGKHIYALDAGTATNGQVFGFNIGAGGVIGTAISGTPINTGNFPNTSILIDPTDALLAVPNNFDNDVSLYTIGAGGALTATTPATAATGNGPLYLTFYNAP